MRLFYNLLTPRGVAVLVFMGGVVCALSQQADSTRLRSTEVSTEGASGLIVVNSGLSGQSPAAPAQVDGSGAQVSACGVSGTVMDTNGDVVQGATAVLDGPAPADHRESASGDNGEFAFDGLKAGIAYHVKVIASGFSGWDSPVIVLDPGHQQYLTGITLRVQANQSVTVYASTNQIAVEQVQIEEKQRILGIIPNFYAVYDSKNAVPLTAKLKFKLATRVSVDPVTLGGIAFMAGIKQAADTPDYVFGAKGYGQRLGAEAADGFSNILIGGAILPSLLHQDPRYFYQGTGTTKSRIHHALLTPFICRGDNGRWQPNYSSVGGDLASSALSNTYYPQSNRGAGLVFGNFAISTAERMLSGIAQEFILPRLTPSLKQKAK
jgi:hypothetical protein